MTQSRDIVIKKVAHDRRNVTTGAITTSKDENERSRHDGLVTTQLSIATGGVATLETLTANEVLVITFMHVETTIDQGLGVGQLRILEQGDGTGAVGTTIFLTGAHITTAAFRRTLGTGRPIILAQPELAGNGAVDFVEASGTDGLEITVTYYMKTISP